MPSRVINIGGENGPLMPHLDASMEFITSGVERGGVLIHCGHGTGRSVAMTIAAVMKLGGNGSEGGIGDFDEAFSTVEERRPGVSVPEYLLEGVKEWAKSKPS